MSRWTGVALVAELGLLAAFGALASGALGRTAGVVAATGALLVLSLAAPSLAFLLWGRRRSNVDFMASLVGSIGGKMLVVGIAVLVVSQWTGWPILPFVFGLMGGWVASFTFQAIVLKKTLNPVKTSEAR